MYGLEINLLSTGYHNEYNCSRHTLQEDLNRGIGWGWLTDDMLPTRERFSGTDACDLMALNPAWGGIAKASKIDAACVTPGYFLDRVDVARARYHSKEIYSYAITKKNGWLILSTQNLYGDWYDDYAVPMPSASKMADAITATAKAYGNTTAKIVFGRIAVAKYCK